MKIKFILEGVSFREKPFRIMDADGVIKIHNNGQSIVDHAIDLENWFNVLIDGYLELKKGNTQYEGDLITASYNVLFKKTEVGKYCIKYISEEIEFKEINDFYNVLIKTCVDIVNLLTKVNLNNKLDIFEKVQQFISDNELEINGVRAFDFE